MNLLFLGLGIDPNEQTASGQRGLPSTGLQANFHGPAFLHDRLVHEVAVANIGTKSLRFEHKFLRGESCVADAVETRVWVEKIGGTMRSQPIPDEVRQALASDLPVPHPFDDQSVCSTERTAPHV